MGEIKKQGINNTLITYTGIFIGFLNTLVIMPLVLEKNELGLARVLYSIAAMFAFIYPVGIPSASIKFFPRFRDPASGHHGFLRLLLVSGLVCFVFFSSLAVLFRGYIFSWYENSPMLLDFFVWVLPMSLCIGFIQMLNVYCASLFRSTLPLFLNEIFLRLGMMVALGLYYLKWISFEWFVILYVLTFAAQLLLLFFYITRIGTGLYSPVDSDFFRQQNKKEILSFILFVAPAAIASASLKLIDASMVGSDLNPGNPLVDAAIYGIAVTIASIIEAPSNALLRIADTKISDAINRNDTDFINNVYRRSTRILMIVGGLLYVGVAVNIYSLLELIPGNFTAGVYVVLIVGAGAFVNMATGVNSSLVFYSSRYRQGAFLLIGLIVLTITLNYLLIPKFGIEGAAIGTAAAAVLYNICKALIIWQHFGIQPYGWYALLVLVFMGVCFGVSYFIPVTENNYLDIAIRSVAVALIYGCGVIFSGIMPEANGFIKKYTGLSL